MGISEDNAFFQGAEKGGPNGLSNEMCSTDRKGNIRHAQSCPTLCDPVDCSPPGSSVPGDSPDKNLQEWVAMPSSEGSSQPRDITQVSHIAGGFFTV